MIVGFTSGCFDLIHFGHVVYLENCKKLCDRLIVGVDCDHMVTTFKGEIRPIIPEEERLAMVKSLKPVDEAVIIKQLKDFHDLSIQRSVNKVFKHEGFRKVDIVVGVENTQAELVIVPDVPGLVSTSEIIRKVLDKFRKDTRGVSIWEAFTK